MTVIFASGKGGTGKTTACAAIGAYLARDGYKVICADADPLCGLDIALGVSDRAIFDLDDAVRGSCTISQALYHTDRAGFDLRYCRIGGAAPLWPKLSENLAKRCDFLFVDAPAGADELSRTDVAVIVVNPDETSNRAAASVRESLPYCRRFLLINKVDPKILRRSRRTLDDSIDATGIKLLGYVPMERAVTEAMYLGVPLAYFGSKVAPTKAQTAFQRIAKQLTDNS